MKIEKKSYKETKENPKELNWELWKILKTSLEIIRTKHHFGYFSSFHNGWRNGSSQKQLEELKHESKLKLPSLLSCSAPKQLSHDHILGRRQTRDDLWSAANWIILTDHPTPRPTLELTQLQVKVYNKRPSDRFLPSLCFPQWDESLIVCAAIQVSLLKTNGSHSPGQPFSLFWSYAGAGLHAPWGWLTFRQRPPWE